MTIPIFLRDCNKLHSSLWENSCGNHKEIVVNKNKVLPSVAWNKFPEKSGRKGGLAGARNAPINCILHDNEKFSGRGVQQIFS